ncbi:hypothetical protein T459_24940 [Capsicum annuum]|uniref:Paired amphipathic helix protein Sin3-like 2 n=1 Tax=Capsicum annuum TaxID=4072 RepID=A0A2G2YJB0_CAPAN|nr:hypothetical protein T459_24940 [Capsicum annuum]
MRAHPSVRNGYIKAIPKFLNYIASVGYEIYAFTTLDYSIVTQNNQLAIILSRLMVHALQSEEEKRLSRFEHSGRIQSGTYFSRIDTTGVISILKELFKGHPNLLRGLNPFLPEGYEILILNEDEKKANYYEQALSFVGKIKERLGNDHEYTSFLDIMRKYAKECNDVKKLYHKITTLFNDYPDLLKEFTRFFLPDDSVTTNLLSNLDDDRTSVN